MRRKLAALGVLMALCLLGDAPIAFADPSSGPCAQTTPTYVAATPPAFAALGISDAWAYSTGAGVTVAVVDSGVEAGNAHLGDAVLPGVDLTGDGDGRQDVTGLGTAIAGVIAAGAVDSSGLTGVAPEAKILPVRVYQKTNDTTAPYQPLADVTAQGIVWAADHGAQIIVVPTPFTSDSQPLHDAADYALEHGALVVAPVGDVATNGSGTDSALRYPAAYDSVLGVTAVGDDGTVGSDVVQNQSVDVAAYGTNVLAPYFALGDCYFATDKPSTIYAAGYIAGIAALVASRYPNESPALWRYRILVTASRPVPSQRDDAIGWGLVDAQAALTFVNDTTTLGPPNPLGAPPPVTPPAPPRPIPPAATGLPVRDRVAIGISAGLVVLIFVVSLLATSARSRSRRS